MASAVLLATLAASAFAAAPMTKINIVLKDQAGKPVAGGFHIGCSGCVMLHCGVVVRASHGLRSVQSLGALKVLICLGLVGFCPVELCLRGIQGTLHRVLLAHRRIER